MQNGQMSEYWLCISIAKLYWYQTVVLGTTDKSDTSDMSDTSSVLGAAMGQLHQMSQALQVHKMHWVNQV